MKKQIYCCLCKKPGHSKHRVWYKEVLVLAMSPNIRSGPKPWVCRNCIRKNSKLTDEQFVELIQKTIEQKP